MKNLFHALAFILIVTSCKPDRKKEEPLFSLLSPSYTGVDFRNQLTEDETFNMIEYLYFNNGAGVAAGDINNDGLADLFFTANQLSDRLYLNKGNLKFEDITEAAGVAGTGNWSTGVTMADVNGDGFLDIYVCQVGSYKKFSGRNQLFINQGNLTFKEQARDFGLDFSGFSTQAAFFDYDLDGDLDMYLLTHSVHTSRSYGYASLRLEQDSLAGDKLFRHDEINGKHYFRDVTQEAGIFSSQIGYGLGVNISDINNDGFPDIYVSNDFHEDDYLYFNNGDGTFSEALKACFAHTSRSSMGNDAGDINNDGLLDVVVLDMLPDKEKIRKQSGGEDDYELSQIKLGFGYYYQFVRNTLQLNLGGNLFSEIGLIAGIYSTDWSWSPLLCDVDNDGWKDLFITNGIYRRANDLDYVKSLTGPNSYTSVTYDSDIPDKLLYEKMPLYPNINYIFKNNHDLTFSNMSGLWGFETPSYSNGSTYADLDNDGDIDLVVNNINQPAYIYRNNAENRSSSHYLSFAFNGNRLNTRGVGARITSYSQGSKQVVEQFSSRGFLSATSDVLHLGLGSANNVDSIVVRWPDLKEQTIRNIRTDTLLKLDIKNALPVVGDKKSDENKGTLFAPSFIPGLDFRHTEDDYTDFYRELLIPHSLSAEGPALATGDINGDGLEDIFAGGAKGQKSEIFLQQKNGAFKSAGLAVFKQPNLTDVVDAVFFDADGDSDEDLYIVSGGNEYSPGNIFLRDQWLINDGKGNFSRGVTNADFPVSHNGSVIQPCDYDLDGDLDLFTGSRSVPGAYGLSPYQFIFKNDGKGNFMDVTDSVAPGLRNIGMVTDACWVDYDNDDDPDLVLTGEWMKVSVFQNNNGIFTDVTAASGLDETSGWWNCISASDVDMDGDIDLIAGNLGLNSMLKASVKEPVKMYVNDFNNDGSIDQVICYYQNGISYPFASLDELSMQMPGLENKYQDYSGFSGKTPAEIFGEDAINHSILKSAVMFESCFFQNNGDGTFKIITLPAEAQFSPVRDILVYDFNADGNNDLLLAGNNYNVRPSYGRYDASYGWILTGDSLHSFIPLKPVQSGLVLKGDVREIRGISVSGKYYVLIAKNNSELQIFTLKNN